MGFLNDPRYNNFIETTYLSKIKYANIVDENVHLNNNHNTVRLLYEGLSHLFTLLFLLLALRPKKCGFNVKHA